MAYQDKSMKMHWITVNGRQVPAFYPQYWSESLNDWVISSEVDRLPVDAQLTGSAVQEHIFQNDQTAVSYGTSLSINGGKTLIIEIFGDGTGLFIPFEGAVYGSNYTRISGVLVEDMSMSNNSTATGQIWQFDVTGLESVRIVVQSISAGQVTIKGRLVA